MVMIGKGQSAGKSERVLSPCPAGAWACLRALNAATGFPAASVADAARQLKLLAPVYPGDAVPSFRTAGRHLALDEVAAMDAVEGRARCERSQQARFGK
jgi:hypothetical protein